MIIDKKLLDEVSAKAAANPRLRMNFNFHDSLDCPSQRLLNAMEIGTVVPIHRHEHTSETYVLLRGKIRLLLYDNSGEMIQDVVLSNSDGNYGFHIDRGQWHSLEVIESGSVILEVKDGPYMPFKPTDLLGTGTKAEQDNHIHLCLAHMSGDEQRYIQQAFSDNWVAPLGPNVDLFESMLEDFLQKNVSVAALSSGTAAIHLALLHLGITSGDEVICQSFTFSASANPIVYLGAQPIFVDSEAETWNMSPELLDQAIQDRIEKTGKKPKAVVVVHLYGMPAKIDEILAVSNKYSIPVVEDAAEALGSEFNGQKCGTFGALGVLSFNGNKMITTSGGGAVVCNSRDAKRKIIFYATQAREPYAYYEHKEIGYNYRLSNVCAGIGCGQMSILEKHIQHHNHIHQLYVDAFSEIPGIDVHQIPDERFKSNYWLSTILIDEKITGITCNDLNAVLNQSNVESRPLWKPMHLQPVYQNSIAYVNGVSENLFRHGLCLPSGPCVTDENVAYIVDVIKNAIKINH